MSFWALDPIYCTSLAKTFSVSSLVSARIGIVRKNFFTFMPPRCEPEAAGLLPEGDEEVVPRRPVQAPRRPRIVDENETDEEDNEELPVGGGRHRSLPRGRPRDSRRMNDYERREDRRDDRKNPSERLHEERPESDRVPKRSKQQMSGGAISTSPARPRKRRSGWSTAADTAPAPPVKPEDSPESMPEPSPSPTQPSTSVEGGSKSKSTGFSGPSGEAAGKEASGPPANQNSAVYTAPEPASAFTTIVAGDAALQTSRLHLFAQQMGLSADQIKAARELYVGNLPPQTEVTHLVDFINAAMLALKGNTLPGPPAVRGWRASEGAFAFIEFRTMEEANNGITLNGVNCLGYSLRIGRPKTYPEQLARLAVAQVGTLAPTAGVTNGILTGVSLGTTVNKDLLGAAFSESSSRLTGGTIITSVGAITPPPDAMCIRNLPPPSVFSEERAREMLTAFGALKFFMYYGMPGDTVVKQKLKEYKNKRHLADETGYFVPKTTDKGEKEPSLPTEGKPVKLATYFVDDLLSHTPEKSVCFFEYHNPLDSQNLTDELESMKIASYRPTVCAAEQPLAEEELTRLIVHRLMSEKCKDAYNHETPFLVPTRCLFFDHLVTPEELMDDAEYADILDDVRVECRKFGRVISIEMPRPLQGQDSEPDWGERYVFVEFSTVEEACRTRKALNGRRFSGRRVRADFFSERRYLDRDLTRPECNTDKMASTKYNAELANHVPQMLKQMEELERAGREAARAAATAAANASFTGGVAEMPALPTMQALIDAPKPSFDDDVDRDEEAMDEDEE